MTDLQHITQPIVDAKGRASTTFYRFLKSIQRDTGSATSEEGASILSEVGIISELESKIEVLEGVVDELLQNAAVLRSEQARKFLYRDVSGSTVTINSWDFVDASNSTLLLFPLSPQEGDELITRNADNSNIKLSGNGYSLNGSAAGNIRVKEKSIHWHFFTAIGWVAR